MGEGPRSLPEGSRGGPRSLGRQTMLQQQPGAGAGQTHPRIVRTRAWISQRPGVHLAPLSRLSSLKPANPPAKSGGGCVRSSWCRRVGRQHARSEQVRGSQWLQVQTSRAHQRGTTLGQFRRWSEHVANVSVSGYGRGYIANMTVAANAPQRGLGRTMAETRHGDARHTCRLGRGRGPESAHSNASSGCHERTGEALRLESLNHRGTAPFGP